ncbi:Rv1733c family protein [Mycolicibacterium sp. 22603]|uniref:Rv1733c family protein n=1 Tax=Mycolicibacterium sp. 22603 TaxID=3453950 RepID=UPI003F865FD4
MQSYWSSIGYWWRNLVGVNPLIRGSDRIEAAAVFLMAAFVIGTVPFVAAAGTAVHDGLSHEFADQRHTRRQVEATVSSDSRAAPQLYALPCLTEIHWGFGGTQHHDTIRSEYLVAGEHLTVWVDQDGVRTMRPPSSTDAVVQAVVSALGLWAGLLGPAAMACQLLGNRLNRIRYRLWDSELDDLADDGGRTGSR